MNSRLNNYFFMQVFNSAKCLLLFILSAFFISCSMDDETCEDVQKKDLSIFEGEWDGVFTQIGLGADTSNVFIEELRKVTIEEDGTGYMFFPTTQNSSEFDIAYFPNQSKIVFVKMFNSPSNPTFSDEFYDIIKLSEDSLLFEDQSKVSSSSPFDFIINSFELIKAE